MAKLINEKNVEFAIEQIKEQFASHLDTYFPEILKELDRAVKEEADENGYGKVKVNMSFTFATNDMQYILAEGNLSFNIKKQKKCPIKIEIDTTPPLF